MKWLWLIASALACALGSVNAQVISRDRAYANDAGVDPNLQRLDIYAPTGATRAPVIIGIHGGGWTSGDKLNAGFTQNKAIWAVSRGHLFVSINYRLSPTYVHPAHIDDVAAAVAWVYRNIHQFGGDPERMFVLGHSAGAHLAALVGSDDSRLGAEGLPLSVIKGVITLDTGAYDLVNGDGDAANNFVFSAFGTEPSVLRDGSPMTHVATGKNMPPFLVLNVPRAGASEGSAAFASALVAANVRTTARQIPGTHESINQPFGTAGHEATALAETFIDGELARLASTGFGAGGLDASFQGAWWDPARSGEGITLETSTVGGQHLVGIIFYTYGLTGQPIHLVGASTYAAPVDSATVTAVLSSGARFGSAFRPEDVQRATWGTLGVTVLSCDRIRFSWAATDPAFGSGSRELVRVLPRAEGVVCP